MFDPSQAAAQGQPDADPQATTTICIAAMPDGTYKVYAETQEDAADQGSDDGQEESDEMAGAQSAKDINGALQLAKQMLSGGPGGAQPGAAPASDSADALFQQGFTQARGTPLNRT